MTLHVTQPFSSQTLGKPRRRKFEVGTTGWTADDLDDERIERHWESGRYEIVEGVLNEDEIHPALFHGLTIRLGELWVD